MAPLSQGSMLCKGCHVMMAATTMYTRDLLLEVYIGLHYIYFQMKSKCLHCMAESVATGL